MSEKLTNAGLVKHAKTILSDLQSVQQDIALDLRNLITGLQQVGIGVLDGVIRPAHLSALTQHPLLTSTLEVLLPHVGSPPLWEHPASIPKNEVSLLLGNWSLCFWES